MKTRIPRTDYVAPILKRAELYMQKHPEKFGRVEEKAAIVFWQNKGKQGGSKGDQK